MKTALLLLPLLSRRRRREPNLLQESAVPSEAEISAEREKPFIFYLLKCNLFPDTCHGTKLLKNNYRGAHTHKHTPTPRPEVWVCERDEVSGLGTVNFAIALIF